jgi:AAA domain, putative AbiEii toxin, Type IV TA system
VTFHLQDRETQPKFYVHCEVKQTEPEEEQLRLKQLEPVSQEGAEEGSRLAVIVRTHHAHVEPTVVPLALMAQPGASLGIESYERRRSATDEKSPVSPVVYLGTQGAGRADLVQLWDGIALTPEEDHVVAAMRLVEPQIERIAFTGRSREADVIVRQSTHKQPVPLGSLGEGTRRMLALSIFLSRASGGVLLIDEIDTGLHYSTLESTWRLVVETAKRLNVQVFATSHSGDCMRALAWLQADDPDLAANVSVHRLEKNAKRSVRYSAEELEIAAQHHIEVRG